MALFFEPPSKFDVEEQVVRVSARGRSRGGLVVKVVGEGRPEDMEMLKRRISDFFGQAALDRVEEEEPEPAEPAKAAPEVPPPTEEEAAAEPKPPEVSLPPRDQGQGSKAQAEEKMEDETT